MSESIRDALLEQCKAARETIRQYVERLRSGDYDDEPTVDGVPISEYPLEVVDERGREFAVVISTGGPHVEVAADGGRDARLDGYWGGEHIDLSSRDGELDVFLDYFIERD